MKLGVLLDSLHASAGGAEAHTWALLERCVASGDEAALATLDGEAPGGVEVLPIKAPRGRPERDEHFAREGERRLREAGCNVVFAIRHAPSCDVYMPHGGLVDDARAASDEASGGAGLAKRVARTFSRKHTFFLAAEQALLGEGKGPLVVAVSQQIAARIAQRYPNATHRIETVLNGVDTDHFQRSAHAEEGRRLRAEHGLEDHLVGLLLARHPVLKGVETAIEALSLDPVRELDRPVALLVAGGPVPSRLWRRAGHLGVVLKDATWQPDPRPLYAAADLLVHPTFYDPCSLVCLEALAMELPVITTPRNGVRELMGQRGGIVVEEPGNPEAIAYAIRVLADDDLRAATADDARYLAMRNRASTRLDRVLALCKQVAGEV